MQTPKCAPFVPELGVETFLFSNNAHSDCVAKRRSNFIEISNLANMGVVCLRKIVCVITTSIVAEWMPSLTFTFCTHVKVVRFAKPFADTSFVRLQVVKARG